MIARQNSSDVIKPRSRWWRELPKFLRKTKLNRVSGVKDKILIVEQRPLRSTAPIPWIVLLGL